nr:3-deoxy-D-manno-octulosonic acid transferase [Pyrinomonadaceae bacterium]
MYFLYSLLLTLGLCALLPFFLLAALRHGKYLTGLGGRLGGVEPLDTGGRPVIWLHCVSVGEAQAARPLAQALRSRYPSHALVVSTTTLTGQQLA